MASLFDGSCKARGAIAVLMSQLIGLLEKRRKFFLNQNTAIFLLTTLFYEQLEQTEETEVKIEEDLEYKVFPYTGPGPAAAGGGPG